MSETPTPTPIVPGAAETDEQPAGFFQNLVDVYFSPGEAFARIVRRPSWILPAIGSLVLTVGFTAIWLHKVEPREFVKAQIEQSGRADRIPAEQREQVIERQARLMPIFGWVGSVVGIVVTILVAAGCLFFVYRFFYGGELRFVQSLAITCWAFFAVGLVTTPLLLTVFGLKGDWNLNPQEVLQANLTLLLDRSTAAKPLWALLSSLDLFSIWTVFLLATGYAAAVRKSFGSAVWGVALAWVLWIAIKVGLAALF
jgi:hypothetical protein